MSNEEPTSDYYDRCHGQLSACHAVLGLQGSSWGTRAGAGSIQGWACHSHWLLRCHWWSLRNLSQDAGVHNWEGHSCRFSVFVPKIGALIWEKTKVLGIHWVSTCHFSQPALANPPLRRPFSHPQQPRSAWFSLKSYHTSFCSLNSELWGHQIICLHHLYLCTLSEKLLDGKEATSQMFLYLLHTASTECVYI